LKDNTIKRKDPNGHPCSHCGSSDAVKFQSNGWGKCFSCGKRYSPSTERNELIEPATKQYSNVNPLTFPAEHYRPWRERSLTEETVKRYKIAVGKEEDNFLSKTPLYDVNNNHVANKVRYKDKGFSIEGDFSKAGLQGRQAFPHGSAKTITVTEGYEDAAAAYQIMGSKYPVVSVHSASSAESDVRKDFEYLNSFDNIVLAFDNDEPGRKAAKAVSSLAFPLGKIKVLTLRKYKDANEYLLNKENDTFMKEWWQAPTYKPDGLKMGSEMWDEIISRQDHFTVQYPFEGLNKLTFGMRLSELVTVTADTGVGKTSVLKHIEHKLLTDPEVIEKGYGVGFLHLEEPNGDTALGLLSIHNRAPYHLPTTERPMEDLRKAYEEVLNNSRVVIWDHFGSNSVDAVLDKVRHMAALGCKYIVLDHLSIIVSDQSGDERKQLDEITTKLKTLCMELELAVLAVVHTNRQGQIRGTAGVEQLSNIVMRLERDKTDANEWRRNVTKITVEKNRFCGYTGPACYLWYNKDTARLTELDAEEALLFENGGHLNDDQQGF
jgi:twinkle protein